MCIKTQNKVDIIVFAQWFFTRLICCKNMSSVGAMGMRLYQSSSYSMATVDTETYFVDDRQHSKLKIVPGSLRPSLAELIADQSSPCPTANTHRDV